jgi:hypothetical protein
VLEREPHAQVGRQARGGDDLGDSDGFALTRCLLRHPLKGTPAPPCARDLDRGPNFHSLTDMVCGPQPADGGRLASPPEHGRTDDGLDATRGL